MLSFKSVEPEQAMWRCVLLNALLDACPTSIPRDRYKQLPILVEKRRARDYFAKPDLGYQFVCEMAGVHPATVRRAAAKLIADFDAGAREGIENVRRAYSAIVKEIPNVE